MIRCPHCGSAKVEKIMDEAMATWILCQECGRESVLGQKAIRG